MNLKHTLLSLTLLFSGPWLALGSARAGIFGTSGNGQKVTQPRTVPSGFTRIKLKSAFDVEVHQGPSLSLSVTTDSNLQSLVFTTVADDTLTIDTKGSIHNLHGRNVVAITMPELHELAIQGSGDASINGFKEAKDVRLATEGSGDIHFAGNADKLSVEVEGSGDVKLDEGTANALDVAINGSGDVNGKDVNAKTVSVAINGSGDASVRVNGGTLSIVVNGSGDVTWLGQASQVSSMRHGSGDVVHLDGSTSSGIHARTREEVTP